MKAKEFADRTVADLQQLEKELTRQLWKSRVDNFTNQLDDTAKIRRTRRDLARVKTVITQRQAAPAKES
jgi:large subunit ribosomal protein L29